MKIRRKLEWEYVGKPGDPYTRIEELVFYEIFQANVYNIKPEDIKNKNVLDVGGHFGMFTLFANALEAKQIVGIEANPASFAVYVQNTKDIKNLKVMNAACTNRSGDTVTISIDGMGSRINKGSTNIGTISLEHALSWFPDNEDVVVKMDIEGAEHLIIPNTDPVIIRDRVSILTIEIHDESISGPGNTIDGLKNYITNLGYRIDWQGWYSHSKDTSVIKFIRK